VNQLALGPPPIHYPVLQLVKGNHLHYPIDINPKACEELEYNPLEALQSHTGFMTLHIKPGQPDEFLPPRGLTHELDMVFESRMREMLRLPFKEVVDHVFDGLGDAAEETCKEMGFEQMLEWLRREHTWMQDGLSWLGEDEEEEEEEDDEEGEDAEDMLKEGDPGIPVISENGEMKRSVSGKRKSPPDDGEDVVHNGSTGVTTLESKAVGKTHPDEPPMKRKASQSLSPLQNDRPDIRSSSTASEGTKSSTEEPIAPITPDEDQLAQGVSATVATSAGINLLKENTIPGSESKSIKDEAVDIINLADDETDEFDVEEISSSSDLTALTSDSLTPQHPVVRQKVEGPKYKYQSDLDMDFDLIMSLPKIPWVPDVPTGALGPGMGRLLASIWWNARGKLRECRCGICERARGRSKVVAG
jgi:hypothetical protein